MTDFRAMVEDASHLANTPAALAHIADEMEGLIETEHFTGYQHRRLTGMLWALRMVPTGLETQ